MAARKSIEVLSATKEAAEEATSSLLIEAIGARFAHLANRVELRLIVQPIEMIRRAWYHLDPRVYSERLRVRAVTEGHVLRKSNRYLLFLLFTKLEIPPFTHTVLEAIRRSRLNLVIISNSELSETLREQLLDQCHLLIERQNVGQDFGGYKDGISELLKRTNDIERLAILNDSLFFFEKNIDNLITGLDGEQDVIGMTEDFHLHYHIQSFALSFSRAVLEDRRLRNYWRHYRPISTRRWVVARGERGLTRQLMRSSFKPHILYHGAMLLPKLRALSLHDLLSAVQLMPKRFRDDLYKEINKVRKIHTTETLPAIETLAKSARRLNRLDDVAIDELRDATIGQMLTMSEQIAKVHSERERWTIENLSDRIVSTITDGNQVHIAGFLFMKYLGMPAFKRDVFFREVYELEEVDEIMSELSAPMKEEVMGDLRQKGTARLLKGLRKILYRHGAI
jgi:hypothetical protein